MKKYLTNERGLSLIEVVAALALLTIVLISFYYLFIQSAKVNSNNHVNYTASAVARELSAEITSTCSVVKSGKPINNLCKYDSDLSQTEWFEGFPYQRIIQDINDPSIIQTEYYRLRQVTIKVWNEDDDLTTDHPKSITYTYQREVLK